MLKKHGPATAQGRRFDDSTIVTVPASVLDASGPTAATAVSIDDNSQAKPIVMRAARPRYGLAELIAACDAEAALTDEDTAWLSDGARGVERI